MSICAPLYAEESDFLSDLFSSGRPETSRGKFSYQFQQTDQTNIKTLGNHFNYQMNDATVAYKIYSEGDQTVRARISLKEEELRTDVTMPAGGSKIPASVWNPSADLMYVEKLVGDRMFAQSFNLSSPSNKPYARSRDFVVQTNTIYKIPASSKSKDAWIFLLNFSTNRSFLNYIPLPGVAYYWDQSDTFKLSVGFPFLFVWTSPFPKSSFTALFFAPSIVKLRFAYFVAGPMQIYSSFQIHSQNYMLENRVDNRDRLYYEKRDISIGIASPLSRAVPISLDLALGRQFDQRLYDGKKISDRETTKKVEMDPAAYVQAKISANF